MDWFDETLHDGIRQSLSVDRLLHREQTGQHELLIFENRLFGRVLTLDGAIQTDRSRRIYLSRDARPSGDPGAQGVTRGRCRRPASTS